MFKPVEPTQRRLSSACSFFPDVRWRAFDRMQFPGQNVCTGSYSTASWHPGLTWTKELSCFHGHFKFKTDVDARCVWWNIHWWLLDYGFELGAAAEGEDEEGEEDMDHQELQRHKERLEREQWIRAQVRVRAWSRGHFNCLMFFCVQSFWSDFDPWLSFPRLSKSKVFDCNVLFCW